MAHCGVTSARCCRIQLIGRHFAEATLLRAAAALEQCVQPVVPQLVVGSLPLGRTLTDDDVAAPKDQMQHQKAQPAAVKGRSLLRRVKPQPSSRRWSWPGCGTTECGRSHTASGRGVSGRTSLPGLA